MLVWKHIPLGGQFERDITEGDSGFFCFEICHDLARVSNDISSDYQLESNVEEIKGTDCDIVTQIEVSDLVASAEI